MKFLQVRNVLKIRLASKKPFVLEEVSKVENVARYTLLRC